MKLPVLIAIALLFLAPQADAQSDSESSDKQTVRTVLITGANRGIGLGLARQYAANGWHVIGTARKPDAAEELLSVAEDVLQLDVTDPGSIDRLARDLADVPVDMLINNAGILPFMPKLADVDFDAYERALAVNTTGPARVTQALAMPLAHRVPMLFGAASLPL